MNRYPKNPRVTSIKPDYKAAFPHRTEQCLCGSGKRFKNCCSKALIAHFSGAKDEPPKPLTLKAKIKKARFELTRYRVWHHAHTRAGFKAPLHSGTKDMLLIDIRAMSDYLECVLGLYTQSKRSSAIQQTIQALEHAIDDSRWTDRIRYLKIIWQQHAVWDENEIRDELRRFDIDSIRDPYILQLYLDVEGSSIGLSSFRKLCELIVSESSVPEHRLQYRFLAAFHLYLYGDHQSAAEELNVALSKFEAEVDGTKVGVYGHIQYSRALICQAVLTKDPQERTFRIHKAIASCDTALSSGELNVSGRADVLREKGEALALDGQWEEALAMARQSWETKPSFLAKLLEIKGALECKHYRLARKLLEDFNYAELPQMNKFDHSLSLAEVACAEEDIELCATVRERLLVVDTPYPYFRERIATLTSRLTERERAGLLLELAEMRRSAMEFDPLRLSDPQLRAVLTFHRCLSPQRQARTLPAGLELSEMLSEVLLSLCQVLLDQRTLLTTAMRSQEDTYTGFLALQLQARVASLGWHVTSQDYGGLPVEGRVEFGRRDITIRKDGDVPFAIMEAVRCSTANHSSGDNLLEHTERLLNRYDAARSAELFTIVFIENISLEQFVLWYCEIFQGTAKLAPHATPTHLEPTYSPLRVLQGNHQTKWGARLVNHILLEMTSHA